jgi:hypothetical protein
METFLVQFDPEQQKGVYGISLVENPAIEEVGVYLSKDEQTIQLKEIEKGLMMSPVLIPNQKILRVDENGNPFNIVFPKETIELAQRHFHINGYQSQSTEEHDTNLQLSDVTIVESWIKEFDQDKSNEYGYDLPIGTWFAIMKIDNQEIKEKIKSGDIKGFSIDGAFKLNNYKMNKETDFFKTMKDFFNPTPEPEVVALSEIPVVLAATMEVGSVVPDGTYTAEDGTSFTVSEGKISEVTTPEVETEDPEPAVDMNAQLTALKNEMLVAVGQMIETKMAKVEPVVQAVELTAETKAKPSMKIFAEPKNFKEQLFNELQSK